MSTMSAIFTGVKIIYGVTCIITSIDSLIKNKDNTIVARSISIANKLFSLAVNLAETITHYKACDSAIIQKIKTAKTIGNVIDFGIKITDIFNKIFDIGCKINTHFQNDHSNAGLIQKAFSSSYAGLADALS